MIKLTDSLLSGLTIGLLFVSAPMTSLASTEDKDASIEKPATVVLEPPAADAHQLEHYKYWRARGEQALVELERAQIAFQEATAAVSRMRRRNHPRGEARLQLQAERERTREAYQAARYRVEVELPAEARRAGAPRHWLGRPG